jgi:hypothetical protein
MTAGGDDDRIFIWREQMREQDEVQTTTTPATEIIPFYAGVDEAKIILANMEKVNDFGHQRIGEIADKLETKYNDRTLAEFAKAIGKSPSCVKRWRSVYRAWKDTQIGATWPQLKSPYSVLRELQDLPDREQLILDDPKMTVREAIALKRERTDTDKAKDKENDAWLKTFLKGFKEACNRTAEAARWAEGAFKLSNTELDKASQKIQSVLLTNMCRDAKLVIKFCEFVEPFVLDEEAEPEQEVKERTEHTPPEVPTQMEAE